MWGWIIAVLSFGAGVFAEPVLAPDRPPVGWLDGFVCGVMLIAAFALLSSDPKFETISGDTTNTKDHA